MRRFYLDPLTGKTRVPDSKLLGTQKTPESRETKSSTTPLVLAEFGNASHWLGFGAGAAAQTLASKPEASEPRQPGEISRSPLVLGGFNSSTYFSLNPLTADVGTGDEGETTLTNVHESWDPLELRQIGTLRPGHLTFLNLDFRTIVGSFVTPAPRGDAGGHHTARDLVIRWAKPIYEPAIPIPEALGQPSCLKR